MAWTPNGRTLVACSYDGTIASFTFGAKVLGQPIPSDQKEEMMSKYGYTRLKKDQGIPEFPEQLACEDGATHPDHRINEYTIVTGATGATGSQSSTAETALVATGTAPAVPCSVAQSKSDDATHLPGAQSITEPEAPTAQVVKAKQVTTVTKDGKRRVQPMFLRTVTSPASSLATSAFGNPLPELFDFSSLPDAKGNSLFQPTAEKVTPLKRKGRGSEPGDAEQMIIPTSLSKRISPAKGSGLTTQGFSSAAIKEATDRKDGKGILELPMAVAKLLQTKLPVPTVKSKLTFLATNCVSSGASITVEAVNSGTMQAGVQNERDHLIALTPVLHFCLGVRACRSPAFHLTKITCLRQSQRMWHDFLPSRVIHICCTDRFAVATCEDRTVYTWSISSGRRLLPCMILESQVSIMDARGEWLLCITSRGFTYVWSLLRQVCTLHCVPIISLLGKSVGQPELSASNSSPKLSVVLACIRLNGLPAITLSSKETFVYHSAMKTWVKQSGDAHFQILSDFCGSLSDAPELNAPRDDHAYPIPKSDCLQGTEKDTLRKFLHQIACRNDLETQRAVTLADLEVRFHTLFFFLC
jgi:protein HIRA/HIR1